MNNYSQDFITAMGSYQNGGQDFRPVTTTTRKVTRPIVVTRENLINALKTATGEYKDVLAKNNNLATALSRSVSDEDANRWLQAPTNKGRLESELSPLQAFVGGALSGINTYGKMNQFQEDQAGKIYDTSLKEISTEDALMNRQEATDLQNALNNQIVSVTGMEKYNLPKDGSGSNDGIQSLRPLDPTLGDRIRENPDAFGFTARVADRDTGGDIGAMITSSLAKGWQGDENLATRGQLLQEVAEVTGAITSLRRASGTAAGMMNSDKEGQRALQILDNPSRYSSEELAAAVDVATRMYDNALRFSGKYEQVYGVKPGQEQNFPTGAQTTIPVDQQKVNYAGTQTNGGYAW